jgi:hypothetical protein
MKLSAATIAVILVTGGAVPQTSRQNLQDVREQAIQLIAFSYGDVAGLYDANKDKKDKRGMLLACNALTRVDAQARAMPGDYRAAGIEQLLGTMRQECAQLRSDIK